MLSAIYEGFRRTHAVTLSVVATILSIVLWRFAPDVKIEIFWLVPAIMVFVIVTVALIDACHSLSQRRAAPLPKVKAYRPPFPPYEKQGAQGILLIEPSELFTFNSEVSIFIEENDFEVPVGVGYILNIQQNLLVQVLVTQTFADGAAMKSWDQIKNNNSNSLSQLLVRPSKSIIHTLTQDA